MMINLLTSAPALSRSHLDDQLKRCCSYVDDYLRAKNEKNIDAQLTARHAISLFVPPGVYRRGGAGDASPMFATFGVLETGKHESHDDVFEIPYIKVRMSGQYVGKWKRARLIGIEGFLMPVCSDNYHGQRFVQIGELVH